MPAPTRSSVFTVSPVDLRTRYESHLERAWKSDDDTGAYLPNEMPAVTRFVEWLLTNYNVTPKV